MQNWVAALAEGSTEGRPAWRVPAEAGRVRPCPQLAVFAEFRQDWPTAVAHYREAYAALLQVPVRVPCRAPHAQLACVCGVRLARCGLLVAAAGARVQTAGALASWLGECGLRGGWGAQGGPV
jgi:hypothetical protein